MGGSGDSPERKVIVKKIAVFWAIATLLASLVACSRRGRFEEQYESESLAAAESESRALADGMRPPETNIIGITPRPQDTGTANPTDTGRLNQPEDPSGPSAPIEPSTLPNDEGYQLIAGLHLGDRGYYEGVTVDVLLERFKANGMLDQSSLMYHLPMGMIFDLKDTPMPAYHSKLTGNISPLCPDPLCEHEDCVWVQMREILYTSDEHMYFRSGDMVKAQVYRSDLDRNHVEALDLVLEMGSRICYVEDEKIYLQQIIYQENSASVNCYGVFDINEKTFTNLSGDANIEVLAVTEKTLWYQTDYKTDIYKTDVWFSKPGDVWEPLAGFDGIEDAQGSYLLLRNNGELDSLYHVQTGELTSVRGRIGTYSHGPIFSGRYVYYCKRVTENEIESSPWKAYFTYELPRPGRPDLTIPSKGKDAGRIYRLDLETGKEETVMELLYNGVPVAVREFAVDGNALFVSYLTYEDHNNFYNQDYMADNPDAIVNTEPDRYLIVDMQNGTVNLLDPYQIG